MNKLAIGSRELSTYDLAKSKLNVRVMDDSTPTERLMLTNIILSVIESDPGTVFFDDKKTYSEMRQKMVVLEMLH